LNSLTLNLNGEVSLLNPSKSRQVYHTYI